MRYTKADDPAWLTNSLKNEIREVFEPRYKRKLSDEGVIEIALNLTGVMEEILRLKWRQKYGKLV